MEVEYETWVWQGIFCDWWYHGWSTWLTLSKLSPRSEYWDHRWPEAWRPPREAGLKTPEYSSLPRIVPKKKDIKSVKFSAHLKRKRLVYKLKCTCGDQFLKLIFIGVIALDLYFLTFFITSKKNLDIKHLLSKHWFQFISIKKKSKLPSLSRYSSQQQPPV